MKVWRQMWRWWRHSSAWPVATRRGRLQQLRDESGWDVGQAFGHMKRWLWKEGHRYATLALAAKDANWPMWMERFLAEWLTVEGEEIEGLDDVDAAP